MMYMLYNACASLMLGSLLFMLVQREVMFMVFSLLLFVFAAAVQLIVASLEFLALVLVIIYVGVIAVLFLFVCLMYKMPSMISYLDMSSFILLFTLSSWVKGSEYSCSFLGTRMGDLIDLAKFFDQYSELMIWCGFLLLISMICSLIILNKLSNTPNANSS